MKELDFSKFLLISLDRYLQNPRALFVLRAKDDFDYFLNCISNIKRLDDNASFYVTTYSAETDEQIYADHLLIRTKLSKDDICKVFCEDRTFEPCYIEKMNEEERDDVEWIDLDKCAFADSKLSIFSLYWD